VSFSFGFVRFDTCHYVLEEFPWLLEIKLWWIDYLCCVGYEAFTIVGFCLLQLQRTMFDPCNRFSLPKIVNCGYVVMNLLVSLILCKIVDKYGWWDYKYDMEIWKTQTLQLKLWLQTYFSKICGSIIGNEQKIDLLDVKIIP